MPLSTVLTDGPHSLLHQSYQAKELRTGSVCADGFGVGWYDPDVRPEPARYVRPTPIWSDAQLPAFSELVQSRCMMSAVRNATIAGSNTDANCAPFQDGRYLFSLNGALSDWPLWRPQLNEWIAPQRREKIKGDTDGEYIFQAILSRLDEMDPEPGALSQATRLVLQDVHDAARKLDREAQLNLLLSDGQQVVATRYGTNGSNSLYLQTDHAVPDAILVASEPFEGEWQEVAPQTILVLQAGAPPVRLRLDA